MRKDGINILRGINFLSTIEMYWSTDPYNHYAGTTMTMTSNRFQKLLRYFHVSDRAAEQQHQLHGKLYKIKKNIDKVSEFSSEVHFVMEGISGCCNDKLHWLLVLLLK